LTIFLSAFLLFQVQPLISKVILPWFGGTPAVWTTCVLFFQVLLLVGYTYAHVVATRLGRRPQVVVHLIVVAVAVALLPILPTARWKPQTVDDPARQILTLLAACVGLPYFVLATTSPLLQAWFSRTHAGRSPYRLYALSNVGSLLALASFPFVVEPYLTTKVIATVWSCAFVVFALLAAACAMRTWYVAPLAAVEPAESLNGMGEATQADPRPGVGRYVMWLLLPACGSAMLLAVTNQMCQDVAVVPFLWVLPLSLYLLSFIICFDNERWYVRPFFWLWLVAGMVYMVHLLHVGVDASILDQVIGFSVGLFGCCMVCHGELVRLKPGPRHLTSFYLMVSAGGALGGVFVSLLAPQIFDLYLELPYGMFACCALAMMAFWMDKKPHRRWPRSWVLRLVVPLLVIAPLVEWAYEPLYQLAVVLLVRAPGVEWACQPLFQHVLKPLGILDKPLPAEVLFGGAAALGVLVTVLGMAWASVGAWAIRGGVLLFASALVAEWLYGPVEAYILRPLQVVREPLLMEGVIAAGLVLGVLVVGLGLAWRAARTWVASGLGLLLFTSALLVWGHFDPDVGRVLPADGFTILLLCGVGLGLLAVLLGMGWPSGAARIARLDVLFLVCVLIGRWAGSFWRLYAAGLEATSAKVTPLPPELLFAFWVGMAAVLFVLALERRSAAVSRRTWGWLVCVPVFAATLFFLGRDLWSQVEVARRSVKAAARNFYGVLRVTEYGAEYPDKHQYVLMHGRINHGCQLRSEEGRRRAISYFGEETGIGLTLLNHPRRDEGLRVGIVGLGVGTLAAYGRPGDVFRFYEINEEVKRVATSPKLFTYLGDSAAQCEVVLGDGRLSLENELQRGEPQHFDVLMLDAFSGDAVPVHLLTKEAFEMYLKHLRPDGVIVVQITNRYLDLDPVCAAMAEQLGLRKVLVESSGDDALETSATSQVLLTRSTAFVELAAIRSAASERRKAKPPILWTDDYSNLFRILK
jgi:hypothetical protein